MNEKCRFAITVEMRGGELDFVIAMVIVKVRPLCVKYLHSVNGVRGCEGALGHGGARITTRQHDTE